MSIDLGTDIKWTRKNGWGGVGRIYTATLGDVKVRIDQPAKGHWEVRGWRGPRLVMVEFGLPTLKAAKERAVVAVRDVARPRG
jgi:hypothetical protein